MLSDCAITDLRLTPPTERTYFFITGAKSLSIHLRRRTVFSPNAPKRITSPAPSLKVLYAMLPFSLFSTQIIGMEYEVMPVMGPTAACSWHGSYFIAPEAASAHASPSFAASPSYLSAATIAPCIGLHISAHAIGGPACSMVCLSMPSTS